MRSTMCSACDVQFLFKTDAKCLSAVTLNLSEIISGYLTPDTVVRDSRTK